MDVDDSFRDYVNEMRRIVSKLEKSGAFEAMRQAALETSKAMEQIPWQRISEAAEQARVSLEEILSAIELPDFQEWLDAQHEAIDLLAERGWWPHPNWPITLLLQVLDLKRTRRLRHLDALICSTYSGSRHSAMRDAIQTWENLPEFRERRHLIRDGFWAYKKRKWGLAVTHWLPHIEGVLASFAVRQGFSPKSWKRAKSDVLQEDSIFADAFADIFRSLYRTSDMGNESRGRFRLNRNKVLHGNDLRFGREANALRVFLLLDALHYFLSTFSEAGEQAA